MCTNQNSSEENLSQATDNTDNNSFRLVAIRPYADSSKDVLKALHPDTTYFLVGDYIDKYENGKWVDIEKSTEVEPLPHDFFSVKVLDENKVPLKMPFINISAIVGKNGCGKSSLTEFLIRLINNVAIKQKFAPFGFYQYTEKAYGRIYYETNEDLHYIDCSTSGQEKYEMNVESSDKEDNDIINKSNFFYSIVSNYSLYTYNSNEDDKNWLDNPIFKNESYQMPIVITPMRDRGNIDMNVETNLAKLRLLSIFSQTGNSLSKKISDKKYADGVAMSLNISSELISYIKNRFSIDKSEYTELETKIDDFREYMSNIDNKKNTDFNFSSNEFNSEIKFWTKFDKNFWAKYIHIIKHANLIAEGLLPDDTDHGCMYDYFNLLPKILKCVYTNFGDEIEETFEVLKEHCNFMNALQFQRLMMIIYICDLWDKKDIFKDQDWALEFSKLDINHKCTEAKVQAYLYVIYETISIFENNDPYKRAFDFNLKSFVLFVDIYQGHISYTDKLDKCFKNLFDDNGRIKVNYQSLKLRQTLNFLTIEDLVEEYNSFYNIKPILGMPYYVTFEDLYNIREKNRNKVEDETFSLLPPPIFSTEIIVKENNSKFLLSSMSSGELQMLYSVGALIYHLHNMDYYVSNSNLPQYENVSLILEEVEQYFHPEYQQDYVRSLLIYIANACFKNIKGINILLVTHSPFVLSDIPKQNVLFLKEGMPTYSMQQNTFGANIHSMLQNGFFLNGLPIGEFAKEKIKELTKRLNNGVHVDDDSILDTIKLVGEPIVKSQLLKMYNDYKLAYRYEDKINELEAKIAKLEKKI